MGSGGGRARLEPRGAQARRARGRLRSGRLLGGRPLRRGLDLRNLVLPQPRAHPLCSA